MRIKAHYIVDEPYSNCTGKKVHGAIIGWLPAGCCENWDGCVFDPYIGGPLEVQPISRMYLDK